MWLISVKKHQKIDEDDECYLNCPFAYFCSDYWFTDPANWAEHFLNKNIDVTEDLS